jgi:hypothetical protein
MDHSFASELFPEPIQEIGLCSQVHRSLLNVVLPQVPKANFGWRQCTAMKGSLMDVTTPGPNQVLGAHNEGVPNYVETVTC